MPFAPVDLIAATAIPIAAAHGTAPRTLVLDGDLALPALPGQRRDVGRRRRRARSRRPKLPGDLPAGIPDPDRTADIRALVAARARRASRPISARAPASTRDADAATAGDCTTFALAYAALATRRGDPDARRHRPARRRRSPRPPSLGGELDRPRVDRVDAAFGAAPAGGDLIGLAIHDADDAGLVAGEAALTQVRSAAWAN